jgi:hypothetical protein
VIYNYDFEIVDRVNSQSYVINEIPGEEGKDIEPEMYPLFFVGENKFLTSFAKNSIDIINLDKSMVEKDPGQPFAISHNYTNSIVENNWILDYYDENLIYRSLDKPSLHSMNLNTNQTTELNLPIDPNNQYSAFRAKVEEIPSKDNSTIMQIQYSQETFTSGQIANGWAVYTGGDIRRNVIILNSSDRSVVETRPEQRWEMCYWEHIYQNISNYFVMDMGHFVYNPTIITRNMNYIWFSSRNATENHHIIYEIESRTYQKINWTFDKYLYRAYLQGENVFVLFEDDKREIFEKINLRTRETTEIPLPSEMKGTGKIIFLDNYIVQLNFIEESIEKPHSSGSILGSSRNYPFILFGLLLLTRRRRYRI